MMIKSKAGPAGSAFFSLLILFLCLSLPCGAGNRIRVAFVGDPQVDNETELDYARRSIFRELRERRDLDLVVILGDLVNENASLMRPCVESLDSLSCPWVCVRGNHDNPAEDFASIVCPTDTAFVLGGIRFICIDDIGGWDGEIPEDGYNVVCAHIPFSYGAPADSIAARIGDRKRLLMVFGHTHQVHRHRIGGVEELIAGAACGSWWRGVKDTDGIPYALMNCGAPRGYFTADFRPGREQWYTLSYNAVGRCDVASAYRDSTGIRINVFGGAEDGRVALRYRGSRGWIKASRIEAIAPEVQEIIDWNLSHDRAYRKAHKDEFIPMRRLKSPHLWAVPARLEDSGGSLTANGAADSGISTPQSAAGSNPDSAHSGGSARWHVLPRPGTSVAVRYSDPAMSFRQKLVLQPGNK